MSQPEDRHQPGHETRDEGWWERAAFAGVRIAHEYEDGIFDYAIFMTFQRQLARWFHKRLSHNYTQAALMDPYHIRMSTIVRDSALVNAQRIRDQARYIEESRVGSNKGTQSCIAFWKTCRIKRLPNSRVCNTCTKCAGNREAKGNVKD